MGIHWGCHISWDLRLEDKIRGNQIRFWSRLMLRSGHSDVLLCSPRSSVRLYFILGNVLAFTPHISQLFPNLIRWKWKSKIYIWKVWTSSESCFIYKLETSLSIFKSNWDALPIFKSGIGMWNELGSTSHNPNSTHHIYNFPPSHPKPCPVSRRPLWRSL